MPGDGVPGLGEGESRGRGVSVMEGCQDTGDVRDWGVRVVGGCQDVGFQDARGWGTSRVGGCHPPHSRGQEDPSGWRVRMPGTELPGE